MSAHPNFQKELEEALNASAIEAAQRAYLNSEDDALARALAESAVDLMVEQARFLSIEDEANRRSNALQAEGQGEIEMEQALQVSNEAERKQKEAKRQAEDEVNLALAIALSQSLTQNSADKKQSQERVAAPLRFSAASVALAAPVPVAAADEQDALSIALAGSVSTGNALDLAGGGQIPAAAPVALSAAEQLREASKARIMRRGK